MNRQTFKDRAKEEWRRLNPRVATKRDTLQQSFVVGFREGFYGFWAPLRFLWWLLTRSWK